MKIKNWFITLGLALAVGAGVTAGVVSQKNLKPVKATGVSGTISIDITGENWASNGNGQKFSILFSDGVNEGWGTLEFAAQNHYMVFVDYNLDFTPTKMTPYRYSNYLEDGQAQNAFFATDPKCEASGHEWAKWNVGEELDFEANSNIIVGGGEYMYVGKPALYYKSSGTSWAITKTFFTGVKMNSSYHAEYYVEIASLTQWYEFIGVFYSENDYPADFSCGENASNVGVNSNVGGTWTREYHAKSDVPNFSNYDTKNLYFVKYTTNKTVSNVRVYLDRNNGSYYVTSALYADADEWAQTVYEGIECSATKSNWGTLASSYKVYTDKYSTSFSDIFTNVAHVDHNDDAEGYVSLAMQRYDHVLERYGVDDSNTDQQGYKDFVGRVAAGKVVPKSSNNSGSNSLLNLKDNNTGIIIVAISIVALASAGGFFLLRKRKEY